MHVKQVVVAYDFSEPGDVALDRAIEIACRAPEHVLHFIAVLADETDYKLAGEVQQDLLERLGAIFAYRDPDRTIDFFVHARIGAPVDEILDLAHEVGADLIVIGSHGRTGVRRLLLGSTSEAVVRAARCPVVIARPKEYPDVELARVIRVERGARRRFRARRYAYTSAVAQTRPSEWPVH
jgi:nucleotide-binding universal stress UspA family protein